MPTHWKSQMNPNYLGAYAFQPGEKKIGTIDYVQKEAVVGEKGKESECLVAHFKEKGMKPMVLNATNCKAITKLYKTPYIEEWAGKQIVIYVDENVQLKGETTSGLRIKPEIPKAAFIRDVICDECGGILKPFGKMNPAQLAAYTRQKYGKVMCADCAAAQNKATDAKEEEQPEQAEEKATTETETTTNAKEE